MKKNPRRSSRMDLDLHPFTVPYSMYWYDCTYLTYKVWVQYRTRFIPALLHSKSSRQKAYSHSRVQIEMKVYSELRIIQLTFTEFLDILLFSRVLRMQNRETDYSSVCIVRDTRLHFAIYDQCSNKCCSKHTVGFKTWQFRNWWRWDFPETKPIELWKLPMEILNKPSVSR